jgi:hypothetical protein
MVSGSSSRVDTVAGPLSTRKCADLIIDVAPWRRFRFTVLLRREFGMGIGLKITAFGTAERGDRNTFASDLDAIPERLCWWPFDPRC